MPYHGSNQGRPEMYVGTTPGTGGAASMDGGAAPGGLPSVGSIVPRRVVNQTIGAQTNHSVPQWNLVRRFSDGSDQYIRKGQFVFCYRPVNGTTSKKNYVEMINLLNLPMVNYWLTKLSLGKHLDHLTAAAVAERMLPHGVVLNSTGGEEGEAHQERTVNCTVSGFADTFNLWGRDCRDGTPLYFVYKKKAIGVATNYGVDFTLRFNGQTDRIEVPDQKPAFVWQVHPCAGEPDEAALRWTEGDEVHCGYAAYVGRVNYGRWVQGTSPPEEMMKNVNRMVNQPQCTVFVDL